MTDKAKTLEMIAEAYRTKAAKIDRRVVVCVDTGCIANGSLDVLKAITEACKAAKLNVVVEVSDDMPITAGVQTVYTFGSGCKGFCQQGESFFTLAWGPVKAPR